MPSGPLERRTVDELLQDAAKYEAMAASCTTLGVAEGLLRLAARIRRLARERTGALVQQPGEVASESGAYHELNVFGSKTGITINIEQGATLPIAPRGFSWSVEEESPSDPPVTPAEGTNG